MYESLHYSNATYFVKKIYELTGLNPQEFIRLKAAIDSKLSKQKQREIDIHKPLILKVFVEEYT